LLIVRTKKATELALWLAENKKAMGPFITHGFSSVGERTYGRPLAKK
jgi:hypothetical protein